MKTVNWGPVQDFRDRRAAGIVKVLIDSGAIEAFRGSKALFDLGLDQGEIPLTILQKRCIDLGSGQGEIPLAISKKTGCSFICVDRYFDPSEKVKKEADGKIFWHKEDAIECLKKIKSNSVPVILASYFLQILPPDKQMELILEIRRVIRPGGKVVVIEEYKRGGFGQLVDVAINRFLNGFIGRYEIYSEETWNSIFEILGRFPLQKCYKFGRNSKLFIFHF